MEKWTWEDHQHLRGTFLILVVFLAGSVFSALFLGYGHKALGVTLILIVPIMSGLIISDYFAKEVKNVNAEVQARD